MELNPACGRVLITTKAYHRQCSFHKTIESWSLLVSLSKSLKSVGFGIGSTMRAVQQVMAGLGVGLKGDVVLRRFLLQSEIFVNKRVDYRRKLELVVIK